MKIKLIDAINMAQALPALLDKDIPAKSAYWLSRVVDQLQGELKAFETARFKLIEKYGEKDSEGNLVKETVNELDQYKIENVEEFSKEFDEIANQEIEIKYEPISISELGDIDISVKTLMGLGDLLKE